MAKTKSNKGAPKGSKNAKGRVQGMRSVVTAYRGKMLKDMALFWRNTDWAALWERWFLGTNPNGGWRWERLWDFIKAEGESEEQREFMLWYLGPKGEDWASTADAKKYTFIKDGPVDWQKRRREGGWNNDTNAEAFAKELERRMNSYDKLMGTARYAGMFLQRAVELDARLDKEFRYSLFLPDLSPDQNKDRVNLYLSLKERVLNYFNAAHERYAKALGINFDDMAGLMQVMQAAAISVEAKAAAGGELSKEQQVLKAVVEMTALKFAKHKINLLPDDMAQKVVDTVATPVDDSGNKKKVQ